MLLTTVILYCRLVCRRRTDVISWLNVRYLLRSKIETMKTTSAESTWSQRVTKGKQIMFDWTVLVLVIARAYAINNPETVG